MRHSYTFIQKQSLQFGNRTDAVEKMIFTPANNKLTILSQRRLFLKKEIKGTTLQTSQRTCRLFC